MLIQIFSQEILMQKNHIAITMQSSQTGYCENTEKFGCIGFLLFFFFILMHGNSEENITIVTHLIGILLSRFSL